jgi:hypothetical protein
MSDEPEMLDLDAAIKPRDQKEPFRFRFGGEVFTTRDPMGLDIVAMRGQMNDPAENLAAMLGEEEWARLEGLKATFTLAHAEALAEAYFRHHGIDPGRSPGSQKSSRPRQIR